MAFPNEIVISGTLCNVEYKTAANGNSYMTGGLKIYQGKDKEDGWIDIVAFNNDRVRLADNISDCFGGETRSLPCITKGKLEYSTYEKDGNKLKSYKIIVDEFAVSVVFGAVQQQTGLIKDRAGNQSQSEADDIFGDL